MINLKDLCETHEIFVGEGAEEEEEEPNENESFDANRGLSLLEPSEIESYKTSSSYRLVKIFLKLISVFLFSNLHLCSDFRWVIEIVDAIERDTDDEIYLPNIYFCPEMENTFIFILSRIPLWSNIMVTKFNSTRYCASSAESENYFKQLKSDTGIHHFIHISNQISTIVSFHSLCCRFKSSYACRFFR